MKLENRNWSTSVIKEDSPVELAQGFKDEENTEKDGEDISAVWRANISQGTRAFRQPVLWFGAI